jgi:hypothetical protein
LYIEEGDFTQYVSVIVLQKAVISTVIARPMKGALLGCIARITPRSTIS